jgi:hypothetical protein
MFVDESPAFVIPNEASLPLVYRIKNGPEQNNTSFFAAALFPLVAFSLSISLALGLSQSSAY